MTIEPLFTARDAALLRVAARPAEYATVTRIDIDPEAHDYGERLTSYIRALAQDPVLREAVEVASASLAGALDRIEAGQSLPVAKLRRAAFGLTRYLLRSTGRPTPFGLFAGIAAAGFAQSTTVRMGPCRDKSVWPDMAWLAVLIRSWEQDPHRRRALRVTVNDLCFFRGGRLVMPYARPDPKGGRWGTTVHAVSVRDTPAVRTVLAHARRPVAYGELQERVQAAYPHIGHVAVDTLLGNLIEHDILLSDLWPPSSARDPIGHVLAKLAGQGWPEYLPELAELAKIRTKLRAYAARPVGQGRDDWKSAVSAMERMQTAAQHRAPPINVDLSLDGDVRLPRVVAAELERVATALWRLSPSAAYQRRHLRDYHAAFLDRYGSSRLVPLAELMHPETGLGPPDGYGAPSELAERHGDRRSTAAATDTGLQDDLLARLAQEAQLSGLGEVVLDDRVIERLAPDDPAQVPHPPETIELCMQVLAASASALDAGEFQLWPSPFGGSNEAGALYGRFAPMLGNGPIPYLDALAQDPAEAGDSPIHAQLEFQTVSARAGNMTRMPTFLGHTLSIGTFADRTQPHVLGLDDIAVGAARDRLFLVSATSGRPIVPFVPHVINPGRSAPDAVRLLLQIAADGVRRWRPWSWGKAALLPRLPRVRYGRAILAPARWLPDPGLAGPASWSRWCEDLDAWRAQWQVPALVSALTFDNCVELDLTVSLHRQLLRDELRRRPGIVITETIPDPSGRGWLNGYVSEIIVPMKVRRPGPPPQAAAGRAIVAIPRRHYPGGEWVNAKLYCGRPGHDQVLREWLPELLAQLPGSVDRWFFVRYRDPGHHLRLRFHGQPGELNNLLLPVLHDWAAGICAAGLASRLVLDTYEPETARYGGPQALAAAEQAFCADSAAVVTQLGLWPLVTAAPPVIAAANYVDLLRAFGDADWESWLLDTYPKDEHHAAFQQRREEALTLIDPLGDSAALRGRPGGPELTAAWRGRAAAISAYGETIRALVGAGAPSTIRTTVLSSLLHVHHNRLVGPDYAAEQRSLAICRGVVRTHRGRNRFSG